jgi:hypothetical protein
MNAIVLNIPELSDSRSAIQVNTTNLTRRKPQLPPITLLCHDLRTATSRPHHLGTTCHFQLHIVDRRAQRDSTQRETVTRLDVSVPRRNDRIANLQTHRPQDVALLPIDIMEERDSRTAVRVVLDARYFRGHTDFVPAKVDHPKTPLVAAATETRRNPAEVIPTARRRLRFGERPKRRVPLRQL